VADAERTLQIEVESLNDTSVLRAFVAAERLPTPEEFDRASSTRRFDPLVRIPAVEPGTYYVLVSLEDLSGQETAELEIHASYLSTIRLTSITPSTAGNAGRITVRVDGAQFRPSTVFRLERGGADSIEPVSRDVIDSGTAILTFDLTDVPPGDYDFTASTEVEILAFDEVTEEVVLETHLIESTTFFRPFAVTEGGGPDLRFELTAPRAVRFGRDMAVPLSITNVGTNDSPVPVVQLQSPDGALISLDGRFDASARAQRQFVPLGSRRPGVLIPSESWSLVFYARPTGVGNARFEVRQVNRADGPLDWGVLEPLYRDQGPADQWEAAWARYNELVGGEWSTYVDRLRETATANADGVATYFTVEELIRLLLAMAHAETDLLVFENALAPDGGVAGVGENCVECTSNAAQLLAYTALGRAVAVFYATQGYDAARTALNRFLDNTGGQLSWSADSAISAKIHADAQIQEWLSELKTAIRAALGSRDLSELPCDGLWQSLSLSEFDELAGDPNLLVRSGINFSQEASDTGQLLGRVSAHVHLDLSRVRVRKSCSSDECCAGVDVALDIVLRIEDVYDFCPGGRGTGREWLVIQRLRQLETCGAATEVAVSATVRDSSADALPCDEDCEDREPPEPPEDVPPDGEDGTQVIRSWDPNEKIGPAGIGAARIIRPKQPLLYTINFENQASAGAAALEVRVTDVLDPNLDLSTVEIVEIGVDDFRYTFPPGTKNHRASFEVDGWTFDEEGVWRRERTPLILNIETELDVETRTLSWTFAAVDPTTGAWPEDPFGGLLPPNCMFEDANCDCSLPPDDIDSDCKDGRGEGFIRFVVYPIEDIEEGSVISNHASIVFDYNEPIVTEVVTNTILSATLFQRGDANVDGDFDISDAIAILGFLFIGRPAALDCDDAGDIDDNGEVEMSDAIRALSRLFLSGPPPAAPFEECGPDETLDDLSCMSYAPCGG